ncbi:MAG TPA: hypothetical protein VK536_06305 [Candidatus Limnocylindrales bacterium]|nr:hypothetical protein [Candidatus Limnocylindrales bacterium]
MMRTVEALLVIILLGGAYFAVSSLISLPSPSQASPTNLDRLALTTLQELDSSYDLSSAAFQTNNPTAWSNLQIALAASLPANIVYNLTVYNVNSVSNGSSLYSPVASFSNAASLGVGSEASSYLVASSNVTYVITPQMISTGGSPITLYILNCSDTEGWWITGYTAASLAQAVYTLLSPYFKTTVMVQNTNQLCQLLDGHSLQGEAINNAVIINTCGEAVPIPSAFSNNGVNSTQGYDSTDNSYAKYDYTLGKMTEFYNWTWVSIVGYPFYYVTNTGFLTQDNIQNGFGIYGMFQVASAGLNAFLEGLGNQAYAYNSTWITGSPGIVYLSSQSQSLCNYYGLYPSSYQTSTRALPTSITKQYNLAVATYLFNTTFNGGQYNPGAIYRHLSKSGSVTNYQGGFFALGMDRIPDIRLVALGILCGYQPVRYGALYSAQSSNRLVVLQLGTVGGG